MQYAIQRILELSSSVPYDADVARGGTCYTELSFALLPKYYLSS